MEIDWVVLCESAEIDEATGRANIKGAGVWRLDTPTLPVRLAFAIVARVRELPALVDDPKPHVHFNVSKPNGASITGDLSCEIGASHDTRPEWAVSIVLLGVDQPVDQYGIYRIKVEPDGGSPVFGEIVVGQPGMPGL